MAQGDVTPGLLGLPAQAGGDITNSQSRHGESSRSWATLNRYAYVLNNPTTLTDPSGLNVADFLPVYGCSNPYDVSCGSGGGWGWPIGPIFPPIALPTGGAGTPRGGGSGGSSTGGGGPCNGEACPSGGLNWPLIGAGAGGFAALVAALESGGAGSPANPGSSGAPYSACESRVLGAVNRFFGTNFSPGDVEGVPFLQGGGLNFVIDTAKLAVPLTAPQFNAISALGRFPLNPLSYIFGYGSTLHVTGPGFFDPLAQFSNSNVGGALSVTFTAHLDTAYAYNPVGLVLHFFIDLVGLGRTPCP